MLPCVRPVSALVSVVSYYSRLPVLRELPVGRWVKGKKGLNE